MPRNEDGEMELVLGNKQLLSVLFILVVLLGVFFTMGYIVGRNNPSEEKVRIAAAKQQIASAGKMPPVTIDASSGVTTTKPSPVATETPNPAQPPVVEPAQKKETKKQEPVVEAKKEEKKEAKKKEEPKQEAKKETKKKETAPEPPPAPAPTPAASGELFQTAPAAGLYLQVAAIDRPGATGMAEAYRKQGFQAFITPSSSATLFRVIIGPLKNNDAVADTKTRLKKIGVDGAILRKF